MDMFVFTWTHPNMLLCTTTLTVARYPQQLLIFAIRSAALLVVLHGVAPQDKLTLAVCGLAIIVKQPSKSQLLAALKLRSSNRQKQF